MRITRKAGKINALKQAVTALDGAQGRVGWFPSAVYENGAPVAGVAYVQEYGSPSQGIPPRPFFRSTAGEKRQEWADTAKRISKAVAQGKIVPEQIMEAVTLTAGGHVAATITKITAPELKSATIAARKRRLADKGKSVKGAKGAAGIAGIEKPLVDSGIMLASLSYEANGKITPVKDKK